MIIKGKYNTADIKIENIDEATRNQIQGFVNHPLVKGKIVIQPDTHYGKGSVIGFTMTLKEGDRICPNFVGVDIGCSITSVNIGKKLPSSLENIDKIIRQVIPMGYKNNKSVKKINRIIKYVKGFDFEKFDSSVEEICKRIGLEPYKIKTAIGSLGGGNHFIELGKDEEENLWLTIHTGSRNFGKRVCDYWQDKAYETEKEQRDILLKALLLITKDEDKQEALEKFKEANPNSTKELSFLNVKDSKGYLQDMRVAQDFAMTNHYSIIDKILGALSVKAVEVIQSRHNYIDFDDNIMRKGAIRSYKGEKLIIPFNMRDGLIIGEGKSNSDWNYSAPHGAGRVLSRTQAKQTLSMDDFKEQMKDICSSSVKISTLDEAPRAYKDASIIEEAISETVTILHKVKPILNIKSCD